MSFPAEIGVVLPMDASALASASREELIALVVMLSEQVALLTARVAEQDARIAEQNVKITELPAKFTATSATSRTSFNPRSSDGYRKPLPRTSQREKSGRKPGGHPVRAGSTLRQVEDPDLLTTHHPGACSSCAAPLGDAPVVSLARRRVAELPESVRLQLRPRTTPATTGTPPPGGSPSSARPSRGSTSAASG